MFWTVPSARDVPYSFEGAVTVRPDSRLVVVGFPSPEAGTRPHGWDRWPWRSRCDAEESGEMTARLVVGLRGRGKGLCEKAGWVLREGGGVCPGNGRGTAEGMGSWEGESYRMIRFERSECPSAVCKRPQSL